ncbi:C39 family peptidase [Brevibacillus sp. FSL K6-6036]|uniref:C39 family peptidase n=1 Tax=Brevibacillus sp. FSL K6-6036 TaxID=2954682 RepID=UPI0030D2210E
MERNENMAVVPYFSQWESRELVPDFLSGRMLPADDPLWHLSGASNREEYATWSAHICGMACLKMLLAHRQKQIIPTIELMKQCREYGGYVENGDGTIKGLFYRPFVSFVADKFGLAAEVKEHTPIEEIGELLDQGQVFFASVHPSIRTPEVTPPRQGGHLVYVFGGNAQTREVVFHNPSGDTPASQENVRLSFEVFARFYAGRGGLIKPSQ